MIPPLDLRALGRLDRTREDVVRTTVSMCERVVAGDVAAVLKELVELPDSDRDVDRHVVRLRIAAKLAEQAVERWYSASCDRLAATGIYAVHSATVVASEASPQRPRTLHLWPDGNRFGTIPNGRRSAYEQDLESSQQRAARSSTLPPQRTACGRELSPRYWEYVDRGQWGYWLEHLDNVWGGGPDGRRICRDCLAVSHQYPECDEPLERYPLLGSGPIDAIVRVLTQLADELVEQMSTGSAADLDRVQTAIDDRYRELMVESAAAYAHAHAPQVLQRMFPNERRAWRERDDYWTLAATLKQRGCRVAPEQLLDEADFAELFAPGFSATPTSGHSALDRVDSDVVDTAHKWLLQRAASGERLARLDSDELASARPGRAAKAQLDAMLAAVGEGRLQQPFAAISRHREHAGQRSLLRQLLRSLVEAVVERSEVEPRFGWQSLDPEADFRRVFGLDADVAPALVVLVSDKRRVQHAWPHDTHDPSTDSFSTAACGVDLLGGERTDTSTASICDACAAAYPAIASRDRSRARSGMSADAEHRAIPAAVRSRLIERVEAVATRRLCAGRPLDEPSLNVILREVRDSIEREDRALLLEQHGEAALQRLLGPGEYLRLAHAAGTEHLSERLDRDAWQGLAADVHATKLKHLQERVSNIVAPDRPAGRGGAPSWAQHFEALSAFHDAHGHTRVHRDHVTSNGLRLGYWMRNQRQAAKAVGRSLSAEQRAQLDALDPGWLSPRTRSRRDSPASLPPVPPPPAPPSPAHEPSTVAEPVRTVAKPLSAAPTMPSASTRRARQPAVTLSVAKGMRQAGNHYKTLLTRTQEWLCLDGSDLWGGCARLQLAQLTDVLDTGAGDVLVRWDPHNDSAALLTRGEHVLHCVADASEVAFDDDAGKRVITIRTRNLRRALRAIAC